MQHDFSIDGLQDFPSILADWNNAFKSLASNSSSPTEPVTIYPCQLWVDTSTVPLLKMRNRENNAWITLGKIESNFGFSSDFSSEIAASLLSANFEDATATTPFFSNLSTDVATTSFVEAEGSSRMRLFLIGDTTTNEYVVNQWVNPVLTPFSYSPEFDLSTKIFTVATDGYYRISVCLNYNCQGGTPPTQNQAITGYSIDGGQEIIGNVVSSNYGYCVSNFSRIVKLNAGQTIEIKGYLCFSGGSGWACSMAANQGSMAMIEKVG